MRSLWKRWVALLVFVIVLAVAFVNLGEWQLRRLDEKQQRNATIIANQARPPAPFEAVFGRPITDDDQWQRVTVEGTYDPAHQFQVRYRFNNRTPGFEVVTPLRVASGQTVLVDRGFIEVPRGQAIPDAAPPPPAGKVIVTGHVRRSEIGKPKAVDPVNNQVRLVNAPAIGKALPYPIVDGYLSLTESQPAQQGAFVPVALPELSEGPHFWYAVQWFLFTAIGLVGLVVFIRGDLVERRKLRAAAAARRDDRGSNDTGSDDTDDTKG
ncbi:SURF1 family cytochrome oxidase biogenesis protein [Mariniluteicoccus flavus]